MAHGLNRWWTMGGAIGASVFLHLGAGALLWRAANVTGVERVARSNTMTVELVHAADLTAVLSPSPVRASKTPGEMVPTVVMTSAAASEGSRSTTVSPVEAAPTTRPSFARDDAPAPASMGVVVPDTSLLTIPPTVVQPPDLHYPPSAYADGRSGAVDLRVFLTRDGTVVGVQVLQATPPGLFDQSAVQAFYQARFAPMATDEASGAGGNVAPDAMVMHMDVHVDYQMPPAGEAPGAAGN